MRARIFAPAVALIASTLLASTPTSSLAAPLEAYGRLPTIEQVSLSDDGKKLAFILTNGEERRIAVRNLSTGDTKLMGAGRAKVRSLEWAGPEHLLITSSTASSIAFVQARRAEWATTIAVNLATDKVISILNGIVDDSPDHLNVTFGAPMVRTVDGKTVVFVKGIHFVNTVGRVALFRVDLQSGRQKLIDAGHPDTVDWLVDAQGNPLAEARYDSKDARWTLRIRKEQGWHQFPTMDAPITQPWLIGLGREPGSVLVGEVVGDAVALREIHGAAPEWGAPTRTVSFDSVLLDPVTHRVAGFYSLVGDEDRYEFLDPTDAAAWKSIAAAYKGERVNYVDRSADRAQVLVHIESTSAGASYAIVDLKNRSAVPLGSVYSSLKAADISEVRALRYKARDGLEITGYLTVPKGRPARSLPLIVLPHGGPESRDELAFDWWAQALASRGYAVLQPNFRGSSGFGAAFTAAGYGEWGRKMQTDLSDGVKHLVSEGVADPQRVCIVGASYGGYAALAGAAFDGPTYRCAVSVAGPSDMRRMLVWSKRQNGDDALRYWSQFMGAEDPADPVLQQISPSMHAAQITIPVLLVHGKDDTVVPLEQTKVMDKALKDAKKSVETFIMEGEDHWLSRGETRLAMLQRVTAFLEQHNPPQ